LHPATAVLALRDYAMRTDTEEYPYGLSMTISGTTATGDMIHQTRVIDAGFLERSDAILQALLSGSIAEIDDLDTRDSDAELTRLLGAVDLKVTLERMRLDNSAMSIPDVEEELTVRSGRGRGASTESGGSFWRYWVDEIFPQDLSFLQVFKKSQRDDLKKRLMEGELIGDEAYELDCFGNALLYLECPQETLLKYYEVVGAGFGGGGNNKTLFSGTSSGWLPTDKVKKVAEILKINICITYYDKKQQNTNSRVKTWQGDEQSDKWYPIGRLAGHYFPDVESPWTHWAAAHLKQMNEKIASGELKNYEDKTKLYNATGYRLNPAKTVKYILKYNNTTGKISYGRLLTILLYGVSGEFTSSGVKRKRESEDKEQEPLMSIMEPDDYILSTNLHHMFRQAMQNRNLPEFWDSESYAKVLKECAKPHDRTQQKILRLEPRKREAVINTGASINLTDRKDVQLRMNSGQLKPHEGDLWQNMFEERGIDKSLSKFAFWDKFTHPVMVKNLKGKEEMVHVQESFTIVAFDFETDTTTNAHHVAYMCSVAYYVYAKNYEAQGYYMGDPYDYRDIDLTYQKHGWTDLGNGVLEENGKTLYADPERFGSGRAKLVKKTFYTSVDEHGETQNCATQLHDFLNQTFVGYHVLAVAHNLRYDLNLLMKNSKTAIVEAITKSASKTNTAKAFLDSGKGLCVHFLDSYALVSEKLSEFGEMFDLGDCKKEIMPYRAYTMERLISNPFMRYEEVREFLKSDEELSEFVRLAEEDAHANVEAQDGMFNMWKYAQFYCERDCEVLLRGFNVNRAVLYNMPYSTEQTSRCKLDVVFATSSAQYASSFASVAGCYDDTCVFSGTLREYMQRAVVGGRVMVAQNIAHHCKEVVNDFDAVSLYPSAMFRLKDEIGGFPKGKPKLWNSSVDLSAPGVVTYYITVRITKVERYLQFPILSIIDQDGGRHFTNNLVGKEIVVDRVAWEDAQKYQGIEGNIICGVYFNSGVNAKIATVVLSLKKKRDELKKIKSEAAQKSVKLIMNSIYGRTIMNPIDKKMEFRCGSHDEIMRFIYKHSVSISEFYFVRPDFCIVYRHQPIIDHWSAPHIGALILSMSKRIMNEVIVLAEEVSCSIHYQDTDSMHIDNNDLALLTGSFKELHERDLVGKELGQFHCDFKVVKGYKDAVSVESVYVGKKMYVDKLRYEKKDEPNATLFRPHIRLKGIPSNAVLAHVESLAEKDDNRKMTVDYCVDLYKNLLDGGCIEFDLTGAGGCLFEGSKEMVTRNRTKFTRNVRMNAMQQERAKYEADQYKPFSVTLRQSLWDFVPIPSAEKIWAMLQVDPMGMVLGE
jgi:hypothetical protein